MVVQVSFGGSAQCEQSFVEASALVPVEEVDIHGVPRARVADEECLAALEHPAIGIIVEDPCQQPLQVEPVDQFTGADSEIERLLTGSGGDRDLQVSCAAVALRHRRLFPGASGR